MLLADRTLDTRLVLKLQSEIDSAVAAGFAIVVHVPCAMPAWALSQYPDLGVSTGQHSISYDIEHPQALPLLSLFVEQLLPAVQSACTLIAGCSAEPCLEDDEAVPHFATQLSSWLYRGSSHTRLKLR